MARQCRYTGAMGLKRHVESHNSKALYSCWGFELTTPNLLGNTRPQPLQYKHSHTHTYTRTHTCVHTHTHTHTDTDQGTGHCHAAQHYIEDSPITQSTKQNTHDVNETCKAQVFTLCQSYEYSYTPVTSLPHEYSLGNYSNPLIGAFCGFRAHYQAVQSHSDI